MDTTSPPINELAAALAKAQSEIRDIEKNKVNPHFGHRYSDLSALWDAIREPLSKNGLSVYQGLRTTEVGLACDTILMHSSGQFIQSTLEMPVAKKDAQSYGSCATYARRYSLAAAVGACPGDEDDDGEAAMPSRHSVAKREEPLDSAILFNLHSCKTMEELQRAWSAIPGDKNRYTKAKDECKENIKKAENK